MSDSELHAILDEIKNKGQVPNDAEYQGKQDYTKIIESFNSVTKEDAVDAFSQKRESTKEKPKKKSFVTKIKNMFKK